MVVLAPPATRAQPAISATKPKGIILMEREAAPTTPVFLTLAKQPIELVVERTEPKLNVFVTWEPTMKKVSVSPTKNARPTHATNVGSVRSKTVKSFASVTLVTLVLSVTAVTSPRTIIRMGRVDVPMTLVLPIHAKLPTNLFVRHRAYNTPAPATQVITWTAMDVSRMKSVRLQPVLEREHVA